MSHSCDDSEDDMGSNQKVEEMKVNETFDDKFSIISIARYLSLKGKVKSLRVAVNLYPDQLRSIQLLEILGHCNIHPDKYIDLIPSLSNTNVSHISKKLMNEKDIVDIDADFPDSVFGRKIINLLKSNRNKSKGNISTNLKELTLGALARWFITRVIVLDSMGLTSYAAAIALIGVKKCSEIHIANVDTFDAINDINVRDNQNNDKNNMIEMDRKDVDLLVLKELSIQIQSFSKALYEGYIDDNFTFICNWLGQSISNNIQDMIKCSVKSIKSSKNNEYDNDLTSISIVNCIEICARPMYEGLSSFYQLCSSKTMLDMIIDILQKEFNKDNHDLNDIITHLIQIQNKSESPNDKNDIDKISDLLPAKSTNITDAIRDTTGTLIGNTFDRIIVESLGDIVKNGYGLENLQIVLEVIYFSILYPHNCIYIYTTFEFS